MGEGEGAGADREHAGAAAARRRAAPRAPPAAARAGPRRRGRRRSRPGAAPQPGRRADAEAAGRAHLGAADRAGRELVERRAAGSRGEPERLRRRGQVEGDEPVEAEGDDAVGPHGRNLANIGIPASGGASPRSARMGVWKSPCLLFDRLAALDAIGPYEVMRNVPGWDVAPSPRRKAGPRRRRLARPGRRPRAGGGRRRRTSSSSPAARQPAAARGRARCSAGCATSTATTQVDDLGLHRLAACSAPPACSRASGRPATGSTSSRCASYGADPVGGRFVEDGKVVTAAGVTAGIDMALHLVAREVGPEVAQAVQLGIEYDPDPPFDSGSPEKAPAEIVELVRQVAPPTTRRSPSSGSPRRRRARPASA